MNLFRSKQEKEIREQEARSQELIEQKTALTVLLQEAGNRKREHWQTVCRPLSAELSIVKGYDFETARDLQGKLDLENKNAARESLALGKQISDVDNQIEAINRPHIQQFHEWGQVIRGDLNTYAKSRQLQEWGTEGGGKIIEVEDNREAIGKLHDMISHAIQDAHAHQHIALKELRALIQKHRTAIEDVDLTETTRYETNAAFLEGNRPEAKVFDHGIMTSGGFIPIRPGK